MALAHHTSRSFHKQAVLQAARGGTAVPIPGVSEAPATDKSATDDAAPRIPDQSAAPAPGIDVEAGSIVVDAEAQALLKGRASQLQYWIEAWASATYCISYNNEAKMKQQVVRAYLSGCGSACASRLLAWRMSCDKNTGRL